VIDCLINFGAYLRFYPKSMIINKIYVFLVLWTCLLLCGCGTSDNKRNNLSFPASVTLHTGSIQELKAVYLSTDFKVQTLQVSWSVDAKSIFDIQRQKILTQVQWVIWEPTVSADNPCWWETDIGSRTVGWNTFFGTVIWKNWDRYWVFSHWGTLKKYKEFIWIIICN
jgi:hypothetical protein